MGSETRISFHLLIKNYRLNRRRDLRTLISNIFIKENKFIEEVNIILTSDDELLEINKEFLKHDFYTDVITFDYRPEFSCADIYISIDRVRENAAQFQTKISLELHRVIIHGVLHLCGYSDKKVREEKLMRSREDYYLAFL